MSDVERPDRDLAPASPAPEPAAEPVEAEPPAETAPAEATPEPAAEGPGPEPAAEAVVLEPEAASVERAAPVPDETVEVPPAPATDAPPVPAAPPAPPRPPARWRRHLFGLVLAAAYLATLLYTAKDLGFARDEGFYFSAADEYQKWFDVLLKNRKEAMKREVVERHWQMNSEHPPLMKVLFGFSKRLFHDKLDWVRPSTAYRLPGMLCGAGLVYLLFLFVARRFGELEAFLAAMFLALLPRFFYHAHLDAFDVPITFFVFATCYAFEKSLKSNGWALATGLLFGLALLTKLNAFFLAPTLVLIWVFRDVLKPTASTVLLAALLTLGVAMQLLSPFVYLLGLVLVVAVVWSSEPRRGHLRFPRIPTAFFAMAILGPLMLWALWPWMWFDTWKHFGGYVKFHSDHPYYNIEYLGVTYFRPPFPFSYPFVSWLFTAPLVTFVAAFVGMGLFLRYRLQALHRDLAARRQALAAEAPGTRWARGRRAVRSFCLRPWRDARPGPLVPDEIGAALERHPGLGVFLAINLLVPVLLIAHPKVFIFGGTKHWMPAWPFLAIFAGVGAAWALRRVAATLPERWASFRVGPVLLPVRGLLVGLLALVTLAPAAQGTAQSHPFALSHYTLLAGGVPGGADWGMCRQFWGYTTGSLVPWLNANVPAKGAVFFHDTAWDSYDMLIQDGSLRKDIRWAPTPASAVVSLLHHEQHMAEIEYQIWEAYGTAAPVAVLTHQGVSIISVYARPGTVLGYRPEAPRPPRSPRAPAPPRGAPPVAPAPP